MKMIKFKKEDVETLKATIQELKVRLELIQDDLNSLADELNSEDKNSIYLRDARTQLEKLLAM